MWLCFHFNYKLYMYFFLDNCWNYLQWKAKSSSVYRHAIKIYVHILGQKGINIISVCPLLHISNTSHLFSLAQKHTQNLYGVLPICGKAVVLLAGAELHAAHAWYDNRGQRRAAPTALPLHRPHRGAPSVQCDAWECSAQWRPVPLG